MSMTRRDYVMLAEVMAEYIDQVINHGEQDASTVIRSLAGRLAADNKAFDRDRFLRDCGVL